jgi:flagellar basal-body rod modification protein FlgD
MANTLDLIPTSTVSTPDPFTARTASEQTTQVTKNMFLQLLVAQIKNQDPLNPSDGVQFLTQLAQFQQLENGINMGQDISAIRTGIEKLNEGATANS